MAEHGSRGEKSWLGTRAYQVANAVTVRKTLSWAAFLSAGEGFGFAERNLFLCECIKAKEGRKTLICCCISWDLGKFNFACGRSLGKATWVFKGNILKLMFQICKDHGPHGRRKFLELSWKRNSSLSVFIASDYGMKLPILRSNPEDQILYQTERYNEETFGYEVPIKEEGDYVLVLKFAEVYFAQSQQKVFDVRLNGHVVVKDLDIFDRVGHSTAHDEIIPMSIRKGKLSVQGEVSTFTGKLYIEFVKGYYDNPKVCALYIMAGTVDDVPKLQPHPGLEKKEEEEEEEEYDEGSNLKKQTNKNRVQSGPRTPNPYASDNSSLMFPILVAFGVFIPTLFCLCRL
ncbi:malectin isoform X2 [Pongo abelii]|uniref:malectin isoform X2 n=1 Tax=Pongo abelii TaxID=9601 RepID=UPI0023E81B26|nr:malectin isoform X2 [Pongo abelii]